MHHLGDITGNYLKQPHVDWDLSIKLPVIHIVPPTSPFELLHPESLCPGRDEVSAVTGRPRERSHRVVPAVGPPNCQGPQRGGRCR